jgi:lysine 2,3-aminomutase
MPRSAHFQAVLDSDWADWRWHQQNRVTTEAELSRFVALTEDERAAITATESRFRMAITPYYLDLIDPDDPSCPIRRQAIPSSGELRVWPGERPDPLDEEGHMPVPGLTHRYPDRALLYTTHNCAMYCRFCTRKRKVSDPESALAKTELDVGLDYIRRTEAVRDVIVSGGDPLSLSNERLAAIFEALSAIPHVETVRIGTRNLVTLPQRVDAGFCDVLRAYQSRHLALWFMTHFNHPKECTTDSWDAADRVTASGTPIQNQMVLLRGVNDSVQTVAELNRRLLRMRVKPYYILHADLEEGIGHFRTKIADGMAIIDGLRGHVSGLAVPQYVVDLPEGGGKVPVIPDYEVSRPTPAGESRWVFRNYRGRTITIDEA